MARNDKEELINEMLPGILFAETASLTLAIQLGLYCFVVAGSEFLIFLFRLK
jgi:hypothetical protein